jgi:hypothetical protein
VLDGVVVAISVSAISKRFGVSRAHVLKLFRDAAEAGLVTWNPSARSLTFSSTLVARLLYYFSVVLMGTAVFVTLALAETPQSDPVTDIVAAK